MWCRALSLSVSEWEKKSAETKSKIWAGENTPVYFFIFRSLSPSISLCVSLSLSPFPFLSLSFPLSRTLSVLPLCTSLRLIHLVCHFVAFLRRAPWVSNFFLYVHTSMHENPPVVEITTKSAASVLPLSLSSHFKGSMWGGAAMAKSWSSFEHLRTVGPLPAWMCACIIKRWAEALGSGEWLSENALQRSVAAATMITTTRAAATAALVHPIGCPLFTHTLQGCLASETALIAQFPLGKHARLAQISLRRGSRSRNIISELWSTCSSASISRLDRQESEVLFLLLLFCCVILWLPIFKLMQTRLLWIKMKLWKAQKWWCGWKRSGWKTRVHWLVCSSLDKCKCLKTF